MPHSRTKKLPSAAAVIVAGGRSRRMGADKLTALLRGEPLLAHTLRAFQSCVDIGRIVLVAEKSRHEEFKRLAKAAEISKLHIISQGGEQRQDSVWNGLLAVGENYEFVAVHDGARPLITPHAISAALHAAVLNKAAACAEPVTDTLQRTNLDRMVTDTVCRTDLWRMQTPQIASREALLDAYDAARKTGTLVTDEVSALRNVGKQVYVVENSQWNIKVTVPRDLALAEWVLREREETE